MIVKKLYTLKKPYVTPLIAYEDIEDDMDCLLAGSDHSGSADGLKPGQGPGGGDPDPEEEDALNLDFSMDFVINDEPQL